MKRLKIFLEERQHAMNELKKELLEIHWPYAFLLASIYIGGVIGLYYLLAGAVKLYTCIWAFEMFLFGGIGLGPGSHRLFSHRSYKATRAFKIFLIICHTMAGQLSVVFWCKVHRNHHKFTDTEKDPTNINRGFLFAHSLWVCKFSPECKKAMDTIDVSDLTSDKDIKFQQDNYAILNFLICVLFPTLVPWLMWNESLWISFFVNEFRWLLNFNQMSFANSFMHMFGTKPYDRTMTAAENLLCILFTFGEGYHNYHHVFPWDYRAAEVGDLLHFNVSTFLLDICAWFGWVYDRKVVTPQMIARRKAKSGDGTDYLTVKQQKPVWGYGDVDMDIDDRMDLHTCYDEDRNNNNGAVKSD